MKIYEYTGDLDLTKRKCVLSLGFFDGVHIAHRDLIAKAKNCAKVEGLELGIFTFPSECSIKSGTKRLYSTEERLKIFERLEVDFVILADFSCIADLTPSQFVKDLLIDKIGCEVAVAGFNYRFGKGAVGDVEALSDLMRSNGGSAVISDALTYDGREVSASYARELLAEGNVRRARVLLGAPYHISGKVVHGRGVGRGLGFPTVNTLIDPSRALIKRGVYRTAVPIGDKIYSGLTNVGICPTFDPREVHAETYLIDFEGDIYGKNLTVYFLDYLREEKRFDTPEDLIMQINIDKNRVISENGEVTWQELGLK